MALYFSHLNIRMNELFKVKEIFFSKGDPLIIFMRVS